MHRRRPASAPPCPPGMVSTCSGVAALAFLKLFNYFLCFSKLSKPCGGSLRSSAFQESCIAGKRPVRKRFKGIASAEFQIVRGSGHQTSQKVASSTTCRQENLTLHDKGVPEVHMRRLPCSSRMRMSPGMHSQITFGIRLAPVKTSKNLRKDLPNASLGTSWHRKRP